MLPQTHSVGVDPSMLFRPSDDPLQRQLKPATMSEIVPRQVVLRDRTSVATIVPVASPQALPEQLIEFLRLELNKEIEQGDSYPMSEPLSPAEFVPFWFGSFSAIIIRGEEEAALAFLQQAASPDPDNYAQWVDRCLGSFFIKPNFPGRSNHVCTGSFLVTTASRKNGVGRLMGETYLEWAPKLGYAYSIFSLVYEKNTSSCRIWDSLGFKRVGRIKGCGHLKSYPDHPVDSIIYGRDLTVDGDDDVTEERFDKIKYYLRHGKYPNGADRAEKSRLRSAATHYKLLPATDNEPERLMLKDKEVVAEADRQMEIARQFHIRHNHGGINKTTASLAEKYHWIRIKETVSHVIRICPECNESAKQQTQQSKTAEPAPTQSAFIAPSAAASLAASAGNVGTAQVIAPVNSVMLSQPIIEAQIANLQEQVVQAQVRANQADQIARTAKAQEPAKIAQAVQDAHLQAQLLSQSSTTAQVQAFQAVQAVQAQTQAHLIQAAHAHSQAEAIQAQASLIDQEARLQLQQLQIEQALSAPIVTSQSVASLTTPFVTSQPQISAAQLAAAAAANSNQFNAMAANSTMAASLARTTMAGIDESVLASSFAPFSSTSPPMSLPSSIPSQDMSDAEITQTILGQTGLGLPDVKTATITPAGMISISSPIVSTVGLTSLSATTATLNPTPAVTALQPQTLLPSPPDSSLSVPSATSFLSMAAGTTMPLSQAQIGLQQTLLTTAGVSGASMPSVAGSALSTLGQVPGTVSALQTGALNGTGMTNSFTVANSPFSTATSGVSLISPLGPVGAAAGANGQEQQQQQQQQVLLVGTEASRFGSTVL